MAAADTVIVGLDYSICFAKQTTFGTAVTATGNRLPTTGVTFEYEPTRHSIQRATGVRANTEDGERQDAVATIPVVKFEPYPLTPLLATTFLHSLTQSRTPWAVATNNWISYAPTLIAEIPSPRADNSGYHYTITRSSPTASTSEYVKDCVSRALTLSLHPTDNAGVLTVTGHEMIGSTMVRSGATVGTITDTSISAATDTYKWSGLAATNGVLWGGSVDLTAMFHSCNINLSYNTAFFHGLPSRELMFPKFEVSGDFTIGKGVNVAAIETMKGEVVSAAAASGKTLAFSFGNAAGVPNAAGEALFNLFIKLTKWESTYDEGEQTKFSFVGEYGVAASGEYPYYQNIYI